MEIKAQSSFPKVTVPNSEVRKITSTIIKDQEYELHILLPNGYANSTKTYPVVYVLDSQWDFPLMTGIYGQQYFDGFIPELIICGITWGGTNPDYEKLRIRDFTPTKGKSIPGGGADKFLSFMQDELFPFIKKEYRADEEKRVLMGCSLGGLFSLYTLYTKSEMFHGYVAASPAIGWDNSSLLKFEETYSWNDSRNNKRMYMTVGDVESSKASFEKFNELITAHSYRSIQFKSKVLENTGHSGTKVESFSRGLQFIFERKNIDVDLTVLKRFKGRYYNSSKEFVDIDIEENKLVIIEGDVKHKLLADSPTDFYSTEEFLKISFFVNGLSGFKMDRFGSTKMYKQ